MIYVKKYLCKLIYFEILDCLNITLTDDVMKKGFSIKEYLLNHNQTIVFSSLLKAKLKFALKTVNFRVAGKYSPPDCYKFEVEVIIKFYIALINE